MQRCSGQRGGGGGRGKAGRTLADLHALDGLVVHRAGALLDELVALDAQVEHLRAVHGEADELLHHIVHDFRRSLFQRPG